MDRYVKRKGYVLLLTLVLLALAVVALSGICLRSLQAATRSMQARAQLQRRWGMLTCQAAVLPRIDSLLSQSEKRRLGPVPVRRMQLPLGQQVFELILSDEQAKVNVNMVYRERGRAETERMIGSLLSEGGIDQRVQLLPTSANSANGLSASVAGSAPFGSYSQLFPDATADALIRVVRNEVCAVADVTCWGNGKLNIRRASRPALRHACWPLLDLEQIDRLLLLRKEQPQMTLAQTLDQLETSGQTREKLEERITDRSACSSLWIICRSSERSWHRLAVWNEAEPEAAQVICLEW